MGFPSGQPSSTVYRGSKTKEHTDTEFNQEHTAPKSTNSQVPGTPVAMVTLGDPKYIEFVQYWGGGRGAKVLPEKKVPFTQKTRSMIVLDPRDEELSPQGTYWKHKSEQIDKQEGVTISLMFRVVQARVKVHGKSGLLVNPVVPGTGKKEKQLDAGWKKLKKDGSYSAKCEELLHEIRSKLSGYYKW